jgi:hypothetical protein
MAAVTSTTAISGDSAALRDRRRDLLELVIGYVLILTVIWTPRPWQARIYFVAAAFIVWATWRSWFGPKAMGLSASNLARSSWIIAAAAAVAAVAVLCASRLGTLHAPPTPTLFIQRFAGYILFACIQQFLLQDFFLLRLLRILHRPGTAIFAAAAIFSLAHLPNPILTVLTFIWGLAASAWFLRYRSLYALAVAHVILGITLAVAVPRPTLRNMRVGLGYLTYRPPHMHHHLNH